MTNRTRAGIMLSMVCLGAVGCGAQDSPVAPTAVPAPSVQQPTPQPSPQPSPPPSGIQPIVTSMAPRVGSTRGGSWATITGADFQSGAKVSLGNVPVNAWVRDSTIIMIWGTAAHTPGAVDVVVTNPGGLQARLPGGFTYEPPESFDFNGDWIAHAGPDYEMDMRFTIRNDVLVSVWCDSSGPLSFTPPPSVHDGMFSFHGNGVAISGKMVSPMNADGTIDVPACPRFGWWAEKSGDVADSRYVSSRR